MAKLVRIESDNVQAEIAPERGGMMTRLCVSGEELLYLDAATLDDPRGKVRGGIPVLFPIAGKLDEDRYILDGKTYALGQHGFARAMPWQVSAAPEDARSLELRLAASAETRAVFPFDFDVRMRYRASGNTLTIEQTYANLSNRPMPFAPGFHPYFAIAEGEKSTLKISTDATHAWDNVAHREVTFSGLDLTQPEVDLHLLNHLVPETILERPGRRKIRLSWEAAFCHLVVWTLRGKDFVCVEPWVGRPNSLNRPDLAHIGSREVRKTWFAITLLE